MGAMQRLVYGRYSYSGIRVCFLKGFATSKIDGVVSSDAKLEAACEIDSDSTDEDSPKCVENVSGTLYTDAKIQGLPVVVATKIRKNDGDMNVIFEHFLTSSTSSEEARMWLPRGAQVKIKQAYLTQGHDGKPALSVLNPAAIEIQGMELLEASKNRSNGENFWKEASEAFDKGSYIRAAHLYRQCGDDISFSNRADAYSKSSEAWLKLECFDKALEEAEKALKLDSEHSESLIRKGRALCGQHEYVAALQCYLAVKDQESVKTMLDECNRFLHESATGIYDKQAEYFVTGKFQQAMADFVGPIRIGDTPDGRGRGLFATEDLDPGDLVAVCNPSVVTVDPRDIIDNAYLLRDFAAMLARHCTLSRRTLRRLEALLVSKKVPNLDLFRPNVNWVDRNNLAIPDHDLITQIMDRALPPMGCDDVEDLKVLWALPGFLNHSCLPNTSREIVGQALCIGAARKISKGEELTVPYKDPMAPLHVRRSLLEERWGFHCRCERCKIEEELESKYPLLKKASKRMEDAFAVEYRTNETLFEMSRIVCDVEKQLQRISNLDMRIGEMIRTSYFSAYLIYTRNRELIRRSMEIPPPPAEQLMEALHSTVPGQLVTLVMMLELSCSVNYKDHDHEKSVTSLLRDACVRCFGRYEPEILDLILRRWLHASQEIGHQDIVA